MFVIIEGHNNEVTLTLFVKEYPSHIDHYE